MPSRRIDYTVDIFNSQYILLYLSFIKLFLVLNLIPVCFVQQSSFCLSLPSVLISNYFQLVSILIFVWSIVESALVKTGFFLFPLTASLDQFTAYILKLNKFITDYFFIYKSFQFQTDKKQYVLPNFEIYYNIYLMDSQNGQKRKQAIIVFGRMGHGKSTFCNTLITPKVGTFSEEDLFKQGNGLKNQTCQCFIRKVNDDHKLSADGSNNYYIIDTPGFDSNSSPSVISEQIDNIIVENKCDIIGLVYVINIKVRQIDHHDKSNLQKFLQVLKIESEKKKKLLIFVLSKFDELFITTIEDQIELIEGQLKQMLIKNNFQVSDNNIIRWINQRAFKKTPFYSYMNNSQKFVKVLNDQWIKLSKAISSNFQSKLSYQEHIKNTQIFWSNLLKRIQKENKEKNISYRQQPYKVTYEYKIPIQNWDIVENEKFAIKYLLKIPVINIIAFFYSILSWQLNKNKKVVSTEKLIKKQHIQEQNKSKFYSFADNKLLSTMMQKMLKNIQFTQSSIHLSPICEVLKINKLLFGYICQQTNQKVPIASFLEKDLSKQIEIEYQISKEKQESIKLKQKQIIQKFKGKATENIKYQTRIPKFYQFYLEEKAIELKLRVTAFFYLPSESNYFDLVRNQCLEMFK